jgi:hypothetical protein
VQRLRRVDESLFIQMVAYGPAVLDAAASLPIDPAVAPDRTGHRDGRCYTRHVLLLGALTLWFHYGTAVFFETIAAGISACF